MDIRSQRYKAAYLREFSGIAEGETGIKNYGHGNLFHDGH